MTTNTITNIIFGATFLLFFASMLATGLEKKRLAGITNLLMGLGWLLLLLITIFGNNNDRFRIGMDDTESNKYKLPLTDSTMQLIELDKDKRVYVTTNYKWNDSIAFHYKKEVSTNVFGVYKITDEFISRKAVKRLIWTFNTPGIFSDSSSIFYLQTLDDITNSTNDTLTKSQAVKVLTDWKLFDKIFSGYEGVY